MQYIRVEFGGWYIRESRESATTSSAEEARGVLPAARSVQQRVVSHSEVCCHVRRAA